MKYSWSFLFVALLVLEYSFTHAKATWLNDRVDLGRSRRNDKINIEECGPHCFKDNRQDEVQHMRNKMKTNRDIFQDRKKSFDFKDLKVRAKEDGTCNHFSHCG